MAEAEHTGKRCTKCGEVKPADQFGRTKVRGRVYLRPRCKPCRVAETADWRKRNPDKRRERDKRHRDENLEAYRAREAAYRAANREQENGRYRRWRANNQEHRRAYEAEWRAKNREAVRDGWRDWRARNAEGVRKASREWEKAHPEYRRARDLRRRARLKAAGGRIRAEDIKRALERQKGRCWWCSRKVGKKYHADHVIPLSRGGSGGIENIVISCAPCNWSKGSKTPAEFAGRLL